MEQGKVYVSVNDVHVSVLPEFERIVRAGLECGIRLIDAFVDADGRDDQFTLVFPEARDFLGLLEAFIAGADEDLRREVFVPGGSVHGTFLVDYDGLGDLTEASPVYFVDLPLSVRDRMAAALEHEALVRRADGADRDEAVVGLDGSPVRLSELSRSDWGGEFATAVQHLDDVRPGCRVRVLFSLDGPVQAVERVWIHVVDVTGDVVVGRIITQPLALRNLGSGDSVRFRKASICEVDLDAGDLRMMN